MYDHGDLIKCRGVVGEIFAVGRTNWEPDEYHVELADGSFICFFTNRALIEKATLVEQLEYWMTHV